MSKDEFKRGVYLTLKNGDIGKIIALKRRDDPMRRITRGEKRRAMRDLKRLSGVEDVRSIPLIPLLMSIESVEVLKNVIYYAINGKVGRDDE